MSPVTARSRPPGPPRPPEVPPPPGVPPQPHVPIVPLPPPTAHLTVPQVRVRPPRWEYRHLTRPTDAPDLAESELNALGQDGWELLGIVAGPTGAHFYFKRERA